MPQAEVLLERETEQARVREALDRATTGVGEVVVVEGAPGIGKTQLLRFAARTGRDAGAHVLVARASEMEQGFAFGVVRQLFEPTIALASPAQRERQFEGAAALAAPLFDPALLVDGTADAMYPLLHGLFWLTANIAREGPLVLCVDDAQWCDEPSLLFLEFLARRVDGLPVAVLVASRPLQPTSPRALAGLLDEAAPTTLHPTALSHEATAALLEQQLGAASAPAFTDACVEATGGNPFLIGELTRLLADEGLPPTAEMAVRVAELGPRAIAENVRRRVARLPPEAHTILEVLAVLGDGASTIEVAALAGLGVDRAQELGERLREAGVLADTATLGFAHPVLRTAVYERIRGIDRERLHVAAAHLLFDHDQPPERIAAHLLNVPHAVGPWAAAPLRAAAARALALGDIAAAERALTRTLTEDLPEEGRASVLGTLGHAQVSAMNPAAAETLRAAMAATDDPRLIVAAASDLGLMLLFTGRIEQFVDVLSERETAVARHDPASAEQLGGGLLAATQMSFTAARRLDARVAALGDDGAPASTIRQRSELIALGSRGVFADAPAAGVQDALLRSVADVHLGADLRDGLVGPMMASAPMIMAELYDEANELVSRNLALARSRGSAFLAAASLAVRSWGLVRCGDLRAAETDAREALELTLALGFPSFHTAMAQASLISCALEDGSPLGDLDALLDAPAPASDLAPNGILLLARARALAARGRAQEAVESLLEAGEASYAGAGPSFIPWRSAAAGMLAGLDRHEQALVLADDEVRRGRASGLPGALGAALRARALLAPAAEARAGLAEAIEVLAGSRARLEHAHALVEHGALVRQGGQRVQAREDLQRGLDMALACGANLLADAARRELTLSGVRLPPQGLTGSASLTPAERRVAAMAAEGIRNREIAQLLFVTEKTVETHLSRSYGKLGIRSRGALARALTDAP